MTLPTLDHLRATGADALRDLWPVWGPHGRRPWRLCFKMDRSEPLRGPKREITPGYPDGLPGLPYEFRTPAHALKFRDDCIRKMERAQGQTA